MSAESGFTEEQKQYLEGFLGGVMARRAAQVASPSPSAVAAADIHRAAQDRVIAAGGKLTPEEQAKREFHPLDMWDVMRENVAAGRFPKGIDVFRHKFFGLFYVAPAQNAFMCRLRMPNGILSAHQLAGLAALAERFGGGYADVTTRANLQIREIGAAHILDMLTGVQDLGLTSRGAGADNIRNITGSPTAGIDPQELIDTRPLARELHHYILHHRELYGLPRKFNIAFDGGGQVSVLEDTNDIGFAAVAVGRRRRRSRRRLFPPAARRHHRPWRFRPRCRRAAAAAGVPAGRGGGAARLHRRGRPHRPQARAAQIRARPTGASSNFMAEAEKLLPAPLLRLPPEACRPRAPVLKHGHIGIHAQKQAGLCYIGVALPVGRLGAAQMRGLAAHRPAPRQRHHPPHRVAEPAALRHPGTTRSRRPRRSSPPSASTGAPAICAARWSRAPAIPAANSPPPTPRAQALALAAISRAASASTSRSTSISPAARIPARSIMSAISGCSASRSARRWSRATPSMSAAAPAPSAGSGARSIRRCRWPRCRAASKGCCATISPSAASRESFIAIHPEPLARGAAPRRRGRAGGGELMSYIAPLLPENAPFSAPQRAWINGWLAAYLATEGEVAAPAAAPAEEFSWHDHDAAARRAPAARRRPPARARADGGDGAAGLRPMRLSLPDLCRGHRERRRDEPCRAACPAARRRRAR